MNFYSTEARRRPTLKRKSTIDAIKFLQQNISTSTMGNSGNDVPLIGTDNTEVIQVCSGKGAHNRHPLISTYSASEPGIDSLRRRTETITHLRMGQNEWFDVDFVTKFTDYTDGKQYDSIVHYVLNDGNRTTYDRDDIKVLANAIQCGGYNRLLMGTRLRFGQDKNARKLLLQTEGHLRIMSRDTILGTGSIIARNVSHMKGSNLLGVVLQIVRKEFSVLETNDYATCVSTLNERVEPDVDHAVIGKKTPQEVFPPHDRYICQSTVLMSPKVGNSDKSNGSWPRKPGDDVETPMIALKCILPVVKKHGASVVYDPFFGSGSISEHWNKLGLMCHHQCVDYFDTKRRPDMSKGDTLFVTQPPQSLLPRLLHGELKTMKQWCILVPKGLMDKDAFHQLGSISIIHIAQTLRLQMCGTTIKKRRMMWVIKGIPTPQVLLFTMDGSSYWSLGRTDVYSPVDFKHEATCAAKVSDTKSELADARKELRKTAEQLRSKKTSTERTDVFNVIQDAVRTIKLHGPSRVGTGLVAFVFGSFQTVATQTPHLSQSIVELCISATPWLHGDEFPTVMKLASTVLNLNKDALMGCLKLCFEVMCRMKMKAPVNQFDAKKPTTGWERKSLKRCRGILSTATKINENRTLKIAAKLLLDMTETLKSTDRTILNIIGVFLKIDQPRLLTPHIEEKSIRILESILKVPPDTPLGFAQFEEDSVTPIPTGHNLKVVSWNVDGLFAGNTFATTLEMLGNHAPDVAFFQETKAGPTKYASIHGGITSFRQTLSSLGYRWIYFYWCTEPKYGSGYSGMLSISRFNPNTVTVGLGDPQLDREARCITLRYDEVTIISAYVPVCSPHKHGPELPPKRVLWHRLMEEKCRQGV